MRYRWLCRVFVVWGYLSLSMVIATTGVHAATNPPTKRSSRTKAPRLRPNVRLPSIPMLRSRLPRSRTLPIFRPQILQRVFRAHKNRSIERTKLVLPLKTSQKRLPTRHPPREQRLDIDLTPSPRLQPPLIRSRSRTSVRVLGESSLPPNTNVRYLVRLRNLGRKGVWRRWTGQIVIRQGQLLFFCPLRSFCKTLRQQTQSLLRHPQFRGRSLPQPQWLWHLRRGLEKQFNYTLVALPL